MADIATLVLVLLAALVYALSGFFKNAGEKPDLIKMGATIVVGLIYGVYVLYIGISPTPEGWVAFLASAGFAVVIIENVLKGIARRFFGYEEWYRQ
jgi:hypothetical protein